MHNANKLLIAITPFFLLAACGGSSDDSLDDRLGLADPKVRLVHAVALAPNVSLFRNDLAQAADATNMPYKGATNYFDVSGGSARWDVRTATTPAAAVGSASFDADRGHKYTLIAVPDAGSLTEVVLIDDPYNKNLVSDNARIRVFNGAFNAASIDVYVTAPGADLATIAPRFAAVGYKQSAPATGANASELEGGVYSLRLTTAGTKTVIFTASIDLLKNTDWLLTSLPGSVTPGNVKVLVVKSDEGAPATELTNAP
jgi:hypothetical protein